MGASQIALAIDHGMRYGSIQHRLGPRGESFLVRVEVGIDAATGKRMQRARVFHNLRNATETLERWNQEKEREVAEKVVYDPKRDGHELDRLRHSGGRAGRLLSDSVQGRAKQYEIAVEGGLMQAPTSIAKSAVRRAAKGTKNFTVEIDQSLVDRIGKIKTEKVWTTARLMEEAVRKIEGGDEEPTKVKSAPITSEAANILNTLQAKYKLATQMATVQKLQRDSDLCASLRSSLDVAKSTIEMSNNLVLETAVETQEAMDKLAEVERALQQRTDECLALMEQLDSTPATASNPAVEDALRHFVENFSMELKIADGKMMGALGRSSEPPLAMLDFWMRAKAALDGKEG